MNDSGSIVVLVNSKDRLALLTHALESFWKHFPQIPVIVFDAGSDDGSREWLERSVAASGGLWSWLDGRKETDDSFSAGLNVAAREAVRKYPACRYFFLYETDNELMAEEPLWKALEFLERHPDYGAVGFTCRKHGGRPSGSGDRFPTWRDLALGPQLIHRWERRKTAHAKASESIDMDVVYTSPLLVRRDLWEQLQGLDAEHFPFSETDVDFAWRMRKLGHRQAVLVEDRVIHDNQTQLSGWSRTRALRFHQARYLLLRIHLGRPPFWLPVCLLLRHGLECLLLTLAVLARRPLAREKLATRWQLLAGALSGYA